MFESIQDREKAIADIRGLKGVISEETYINIMLIILLEKVR